MADEVGVPEDLLPLKEPLIEAVVNAYMAQKIPSEGPFEYEWGSCAKGEFRYKHSRWGLDSRAYCYYPDGNWMVDNLGPDDDRSPGDRVGTELVLFDAKAVFDEIRETVSSWVDPWIACQSPEVFTNQIESMAYVVDQLYVQDEVTVGGRSVEGDDPPGATSIPVLDVQSAIADMQSDLSSLNGLAIDALERSYVNDVGLTISGQRALAAVAALAIAGEAEAWSRAFGGLASLFDRATDDFNAFADTGEDAGGGSGGTTLAVISGTAGAASAASFAFPPAAAVLGVIAGLAGIGAAFWPPQEVGPDEPKILLVLDGGDFDSLWTSFKGLVEDVNGELVAAEHALSTMCRNVVAEYESYPEAFSITENGTRGVPQAGDNLPRFLNTEAGSAPIELYAGDLVRVVHAKLRSVAARIEHIGDHQRQVAQRLGGSDSSGNPSALVADEWTREYLQGGIIGWGPDGHYGDYERVVETLVRLLIAESKTAHRIAEHCLDISTGFSRTDQQIEAELNKLERKLDP